MALKCPNEKVNCKSMLDQQFPRLGTGSINRMFAVDGTITFV